MSEENVNGGEDKCHSDFVPLPNNTWASGAGGGSQKIYIFLHFAKQVSLDIFATDICFCCLKTDIGPFVQDVTKNCVAYGVLVHSRDLVVFAKETGSMNKSHRKNHIQKH